MQTSEKKSAAGAIHFLLNGELVVVPEISPTTTVLNYLREEKSCKGTKEGCAEGDCGACTVVLAELDNKSIKMKSVNACIQFVPTLQGKAVFTVEYLRQNTGKLHPVQQAMVDCHGSQCGFCTPGFVMSLWAVYNEHQSEQSRPERAEVRSALTGNLCRCTGYRPILDAADAMFELPKVTFDWNTLKAELEKLQDCDPSESGGLDIKVANEQFFAPKSLNQLLKLRATYPEATILAGGTDVGLWINKQFKELPIIIYLGDVAELKQCEHSENGLKIGAGVTLTDAYAAVSAIYPEMDQLWERFASQPIRNIGTLGGNVANGSPIGDSMPALIAAGASVVLSSIRGNREMPLEDLYLDYMKKDMATDEIVTAIRLPQPAAEQMFRCYKLSKRHDSDISAVFAAFSVQLDKNKVTYCKIAFGGMAATPKRAVETEHYLLGKTWDEATVKQAMQQLDQDFTPLSDMRASEQNRMHLAMNLLYRFYLETQPNQALADHQVNVFNALAGQQNHQDKAGVVQ